MHRDLARLSNHRFDLLVVGGGIYGLIVAADAADRGLDVALIERRDFGSGTSFNHLRTIHGGLRYLQTLDLARARESIRERRTLAVIAPAALQAVPFVLPLGRSLKRGPLALRAAFLIDGLVAGDRNVGLDADHRLPPGRVVGRDELLQMVPSLSSAPTVGAAVWYDYVTSDADRLTFAWAEAASRSGAALANYVEAIELTIEGARIAGLRAIDHRSGQPFDIAATVVVNATGGAIDRLLQPAGIHTAIPMIKAMNLVTRRPASAFALGGQTQAGKALFSVPWKGRTIIGTWESAHLASPSDAAVHRADVESFLRDINEAFTGAPLRLDEVTLVHRGIVPAIRLAGGRAVLDGQEQIHDHDVDGIEGLISVAGTKNTTARAVAQRVVDLVAARFDRLLGPVRTAKRPLPVVARSGDEGLRAAAADEMVETLEDAVVRRTSLGALGDPGRQVLEHAAEVVGQVLGWDGERRRAEIDALQRFYGTVKPWNT